jgi:hypothetical protein
VIVKLVSQYFKRTQLDSHHRFKSWEHCFKHFQSNYENLKDENALDRACLQLAFYLASWGMMRGGTFLLQKDYRIHEYFIRDVAAKAENQRFFSLAWTTDQRDYVGMNRFIDDLRKAYVSHIYEVNGQPATVSVSDTLASKIILGMYGCVPAYDRYFVEGLKMHGITKLSFEEDSLAELLDFYQEYRDEFDECLSLFSDHSVAYPLMKVIDMYFWQVGYCMDNVSMYPDQELQEIAEFASTCKAGRKRLRTHAKKDTFQPSVPSLRAERGQTEQIRQYIRQVLGQAKDQGLTHLELVSGEVHKALKLQSRLPSVCNAMISLDEYEYEIIHDTPSGLSSTKRVRYELNGNRDQ